MVVMVLWWSQLWHSLDDVELVGDVIVRGDVSEIVRAKKRWTEHEIIVKRYQLTRTASLKDDKALLNELTTFQLTRKHGRFVQLSGICKSPEFLYIEIERMEGVNRYYCT